MVDVAVPEPELACVPVVGGEIPVRLYLPAAGPGPGLVLVQEIFGISDYIVQRARDLAALGYVVAVPELYWRLGFDAIGEDSPDALSEAMSAAQDLGLEQAIEDTAAVLKWLPTRAEVASGDGDTNVGVLGFCFGGGVAFGAAASLNAPDLPQALVSYYGSALPALTGRAGRVHAPSLHHWGADDAFIPLATQEEIRPLLEREGVTWFTYEGAGHAFDNPAPAFHDAAASELAWRRTVQFLERTLPLA